VTDGGPRLRPGDLVEVRTPDEILRTLDVEGALDRLPFMPEMIEFCGRRFRVAQRVVKTCFTGPRSSPRRFRGADVVLLDDLRCSGAAHDGCQKSCVLFWREAWLRRVEERDAPATASAEGPIRLRSRLKTSTGPRKYFCQASELLNATDHLSRWGRYRSCVTEVRSGNCSALEMARRIVVFAVCKLGRRFAGGLRRGDLRATPTESLGLRPGELVEVKPLADIVETLDARGRNRGLDFTRGMRAMCGRLSRVKGRIDRIIVDGTGEMRQLRDTVQLEGSLCACEYQMIGGCSRCEINYWREIWVRRAAERQTSAARPDAASPGCS
jgi:hypothetical protein